MRALQLQAVGRLEEVRVSVPQPGPREVLVRTLRGHHLYLGP